MSCAEARLQKLFEERESLHDEVSSHSSSVCSSHRLAMDPDRPLYCVQVRLLRSRLAQGDSAAAVQDPEGGALENGIQSHLLELQSECGLLLSLCIVDGAVSQT